MTHEPADAEALADRKIVLRNGMVDVSATAILRTSRSNLAHRYVGSGLMLTAEVFTAAKRSGERKTSTGPSAAFVYQEPPPISTISLG